MDGQSGAHRPPATLDLKDMLRIVAERWPVIAGMAAAGMLVGLFLALATTPRYRSFALLDYDPNATEAIDQTGGARPGKAFQASQELMATQLGLLGSDALARRVAEDLHLADDPAFGGAGTLPERIGHAAAVVRAGTSADALKGSLLIRVGFTSPDPQRAADVVNAVARAFIATSLERKYNASSYARKFLSDQLANTRKALEASERALNDYAIRTDLFRAPGLVVDGHATEGRTLSDTDLSALEDAFNQARVRRIAAETTFLNSAGPQATDGSSAVATLAQQRAAMQAEYAQNTKLFKPDYPQQRQLQAQIDRLGGLIEAERQRQTGSQAKQLNADYQAARQAEDRLSAQVAGLKHQVQGERTSAIQYNILQREVDTNRALYDALLQRFKEVGVAGGITQSNLSLVDPGDVPKAPFRPSLPINLGMGLILGTAVGIGAVFVLHLLLDVVTDGADVRDKLGLRLLGTVPRERDGLTLDLAAFGRPSPVNEAYHSALTAIRSLRPGPEGQVLFVTSSRPAEGKSTSTYALAAITARLGRRVLLIDADLRRPTLATQRPDMRGLGHLLEAGGSLADAVRPSGYDGLSVLPVGRFSAAPAELLSSPRLAEIMNEARRGFDLVMLDGPPVLGLTDAPLLGAVADAIILVAESGRSRTAGIEDMVRRLRDAGGTVLGVLITKVQRTAGGYAYDYYSYSRPDGASGRRLPGWIARARQRDA